jgi:hypothetical protein
LTEKHSQPPTQAASRPQSARRGEPAMPPVPSRMWVREVTAVPHIDLVGLQRRLRGSLLNGIKPDRQVKLLDGCASGPWGVLDVAHSRLSTYEARDVFDQLAADAILINPRASDRAAIASFAGYAAACFRLSSAIHADCGLAVAALERGDMQFLAGIAKNTLSAQGIERDPDAEEIKAYVPRVIELRDETAFAASLETFLATLNRLRWCAPQQRIHIRPQGVRP